MAVDPIRPFEITSKRKTTIPDEVFTAFNELIAAKWTGYESIVMQEEVVTKIAVALKLQDTKIIFESHWLDIEEAYREAGWLVTYSKPSYCESYPASFKFVK